MKILAKNKRAYFDYEIFDNFEAGVVLTGQEVKSAKTGGMELTSAYARITNEEVYLLNGHIKAYAHASNLEGYDPTQNRKLLLKKAEIKKLIGRIQEKGLTLLALEAYVKNGRIKIKLGLGRSKKKFDKRDLIKKRESDRKIGRATKNALRKSAR